MVSDIELVTTADHYKVVYDLPIGAIFSDLSDPCRFPGHGNIRH